LEQPDEFPYQPEYSEGRHKVEMDEEIEKLLSALRWQSRLNAELRL
jgi:hypothetical protein